jgi:hypothetical protein
VDTSWFLEIAFRIVQFTPFGKEHFLKVGAILIFLSWSTFSLANGGGYGSWSQGQSRPLSEVSTGLEGQPGGAGLSARANAP